jgi:hypothetical protein
VPQPLAERCKVYTIGMDQILHFLRHEAQYNLLIREKTKNFRPLVPTGLTVQRTPYG